MTQLQRRPLPLRIAQRVEYSYIGHVTHNAHELSHSLTHSLTLLCSSSSPHPSVSCITLLSVSFNLMFWRRYWDFWCKHKHILLGVSLVFSAVGVISTLVSTTGWILMVIPYISFIHDALHLLKHHHNRSGLANPSHHTDSPRLPVDLSDAVAMSDVNASESLLSTSPLPDSEEESHSEELETVCLTQVPRFFQYFMGSACDVLKPLGTLTSTSEAQFLRQEGALELNHQFIAHTGFSLIGLIRELSENPRHERSIDEWRWHLSNNPDDPREILHLFLLCHPHYSSNTFDRVLIKLKSDPQHTSRFYRRLKVLLSPYFSLPPESPPFSVLTIHSNEENSEDDEKSLYASMRRG